MTDATPSPRQTFHTIHKALPHMAGAALADLRRLRPEDPSSTTFWRIAALYLEPHLFEGTWRDVQERRWASALNALAILHELHTPGVQLGRSLAEASLSELRFSQLLRARGEQLEAQVRRTARLLASKGSRVDVTGFLDLLLSQDGQHAERVRRQIARDFFYVPAKEQ